MLSKFCSQFEIEAPARKGDALAVDKVKSALDIYTKNGASLESYCWSQNVDSVTVVAYCLAEAKV